MFHYWTSLWCWNALVRVAILQISMSTPTKYVIATPKNWHTHTHTHKYTHLQNICTKSDFKLITIHMFIKIWMFPINKFRCKQRKRWNQIEINTCIYLQFTWRELHYASLKHLLTLITCFLRVSANLISSCPFQVKTKSFGKRMPFFKTVRVG